MANRALIWLLALFPWVDFSLRMSAKPFPPLGTLVRGWDEILLIACLSVGLASHEARGPISVPRPILLGLVVFVVAGVLSILVNQVPVAIAVDAFRVIYQPIVFVAVGAHLLRDERSRDELVGLTIASAVAVAVVAITQYALGVEGPRWHNKPHAEQFRAVAIFANPNALAGYLNMAMALSLAIAVSARSAPRRWLHTAAALVLAGALFVTLSRTGWIAFAALCGFYLWMTRKALFLVLLLTFMALVLASTAGGDRATEIVASSYYEQSARYGRVSFWKEALTTIRDHPVLGVGPGMAGGSVAIRHGVPGATWIDNHYLKLGAELGLIGLAGFVLLLVAFFSQAIAAARNAPGDGEKAIGLGCCGVLLVMALQNGTASLWESLYVGPTFYVLLGMLLVLPVLPGRRRGGPG